ncbi:uncharacterized protein LOC127479803 [Manacus candei]|uniref:uncharacterized protein LOC127479803 n=1 Tax=Manacus candei TaxID=415023 RepID=UPI0022274B6E|nr:uncharacterized protein LOC127479803 [Manacus candei]
MVGSGVGWWALPGPEVGGGCRWSLLCVGGGLAGVREESWHRKGPPVSPDMWPQWGRGQEPDTGGVGQSWGLCPGARLGGERGRWGTHRTWVMGCPETPHTPVGTPRASQKQAKASTAPCAMDTWWHCGAELGGCAPPPPGTSRPPAPPHPAARSVCGGDQLPAAVLENLPFASFLPACLPSDSSLGTPAASAETETGLSSTYFPAAHRPWCNFTPRCPHLRGASAAPRAWRGRQGGRGGCGWTDRFEFSFPALLISCHANPDTGKSLDHAERLRVSVCVCVSECVCVSAGGGSQPGRDSHAELGRENRRTCWHRGTGRG